MLLLQLFARPWTTAASPGLGTFYGQIVKTWPFSEVVFVANVLFGLLAFLSIFENLAELWPNLHVVPHSGI